MSETAVPLRPELPPLDLRIAGLPVRRGYPVPWFASWLDPDTGRPADRGHGEPDFRVLHPGALEDAVRFGLCWVCGHRYGGLKAFVAGPMCGVNRTSSEPPCHVGCASWSAIACPHLVRPHARRRAGDLPEDAEAPAGVALTRNPGVAMVWVTRRFTTVRVPQEIADRIDGARAGTLIRMGDPVRVEWYREGRPATRAEVVESVDSGMPALRGLAEAQGPAAARELDRLRAALLDLGPDE